MGLFSRKPDSPPRGYDADDAKVLAAVHRDLDAHRPEKDQPKRDSWHRNSADTSGPSAPTANSPKRGRRW
ncbi:hypothetical protein V2W30_20135 [Streptomyces sp. Q6]|uniref:Uncharacterized protein n=1 Tax=Streptomyces citrinus TaxID=3118173 RepID=A0ACD5ADV4_9ACTN